MPLGDERPVAGIVVPILDRLLAWKFDNDDAAWPSPFEHFMCASFGQITSAALQVSAFGGKADMTSCTASVRF